MSYRRPCSLPHARSLRLERDLPRRQRLCRQPSGVSPLAFFVMPQCPRLPAPSSSVFVLCALCVLCGERPSAPGLTPRSNGLHLAVTRYKSLPSPARLASLAPCLFVVPHCPRLPAPSLSVFVLCAFCALCGERPSAQSLTPRANGLHLALTRYKSPASPAPPVCSCPWGPLPARPQKRPPQARPKLRRDTPSPG